MTFVSGRSFCIASANHWIAAGSPCTSTTVFGDPLNVGPEALARPVCTEAELLDETLQRLRGNSGLSWTVPPCGVSESYLPAIPGRSSRQSRANGPDRSAPGGRNGSTTSSPSSFRSRARRCVPA